RHGLSPQGCPGHVLCQEPELGTRSIHTAEDNQGRARRKRSVLTTDSALLDATAGKSPPRVLVLLASYNGARWIGRQIESILAQEAVDVRIVIADDGSSDGTLE